MLQSIPHLPTLEDTRPTTLPPIMPPTQNMATTRDQMKVTEVSHDTSSADGAAAVSPSVAAATSAVAVLFTISGQTCDFTHFFINWNQTN